MSSAGFGQVVSRPSDRRVNTQVSRSGLVERSCLNDEALATSVVFQSMREKERQLREYKFKYDTLKLLYDELVSVLKQQALLLPVTPQECQKPHKWNHISTYMERELTFLKVSKPDVSRILQGLHQRLGQVCTVFASADSELRERTVTTGSVKVHRHDSQLETQEGRISSGADSAKSANYSVIGVASNRIDPSLGHRRPERPSQGISNLLLQRFLTNSLTSGFGVTNTGISSHPAQTSQASSKPTTHWLGDKKWHQDKPKEGETQVAGSTNTSTAHLGSASPRPHTGQTGTKAEHDWTRPL